MQRNTAQEQNMVQDTSADTEPFEIINHPNHEHVNPEVDDLFEELVYGGLDAEGQPLAQINEDNPRLTIPTIPATSSQGQRSLVDRSVQSIRFPLEPGEVEPIPHDMDQVLRREFDVGSQSPQYSQGSSQGSNISQASLNEDSRYLRYASFDSTTGGLYSPAGSQPSSQTASLPIQYPSSQESTGFDESLESSLLDRLQGTSVVPNAVQLYLQQFLDQQQNQGNPS